MIYEYVSLNKKSVTDIKENLMHQAVDESKETCCRTSQRSWEKKSLVETDLKVKKSSYGESFTIIQLDEILTD